MDDGHRQKIHIVWASVFMCAICTWGVTMAIAAPGPPEEVTILLALGLVLSVVNVPLLLSQPGNSSALLAGGRILVWLQVVCFVGACVVGLAGPS